MSTKPCAHQVGCSFSGLGICAVCADLLPRQPHTLHSVAHATSRPTPSPLAVLTRHASPRPAPCVLIIRTAQRTQQHDHTCTASPVPSFARSPPISSTMPRHARLDRLHARS